MIKKHLRLITISCASVWDIGSCSVTETFTLLVLAAQFNVNSLIFLRNLLEPFSFVFFFFQKVQRVSFRKQDLVLELTGELNISSRRCFGSLPFFDLTIMQMCAMSGRHRRNFSIITFPKNPVPPVTRILRPAKVSATLSGTTSSVLSCSIVTEGIVPSESYPKIQATRE